MYRRARVAALGPVAVEPVLPANRVICGVEARPGSREAAVVRTQQAVAAIGIGEAIDATLIGFIAPLICGEARIAHVGAAAARAITAIRPRAIQPVVANRPWERRVLAPDAPAPIARADVPIVALGIVGALQTGRILSVGEGVAVVVETIRATRVPERAF